MKSHRERSSLVRIFRTPGWLAAVPALLVLAACGGDEEATESLSLKVVDAAGTPVTAAEVYVHVPEGAPPEAAGDWDPETATLTLPIEPRERRVIVQATGYRSEEVVDLAEDRTLVLEHGFLVRLSVAEPAPEMPPSTRLVFGIRPAPPEEAALTVDERMKIVELMALATPLAEGEPDLPQGAPGLTLVDTAADRGILLPVSGQYSVRWGLFDSSAGVWYSLTEAGEELIAVAEDGERAQRFAIPVSEDALERAKTGLAKRVADLASAREEGGAGEDEGAPEGDEEGAVGGDADAEE